MGAAGIIVLHFSPQDLRRNRAMVIQRIRATLTRGLERPPLPIRTVPSSQTAAPPGLTAAPPS
jgi:hypothetical protein